MTTEKKPKAFFTLNLPRKPRDGDSIKIQAKLRKNPNEFRVVLGVRTAGEKNSSIEPKWVALDFKTIFSKDGIKVTASWKADSGWQREEEILDSDWIDLKGNVDLTITFDGNASLITDGGKSLITRFPLQFELDKINRVQLWGNVKEMLGVSLKYNRRSPRRKSNQS